VGAQIFAGILGHTEIDRARNSAPSEHDFRGDGLDEAIALPWGSPGDGSDGPADLPCARFLIGLDVTRRFDHWSAQDGGDPAEWNNQHGESGQKQES